MDFSKLTLSSARIQEDLVMVDDTFLTKKGCKIYIPCSFEDTGLVTMGEEVLTIGAFAYVIEDKYFSVALASAKILLSPTTIGKVKIADEPYYELYFEPGSIVIANKNLVKDNTLCYYIYDEIESKGNVPEYFTYIHLLRLFEQAPYYAGMKVGANKAHIEFVGASIARSQEDKLVYYREVLSSLDDIRTKPPTYVPFVSVMYNATNTMSRLSGGYFVDEGITASLVNKTERLEPIEELLRR